MEYIQIINGKVNLIGGEELGLPLSEAVLAARPDVRCFEASQYPDAKLGMFYLENEDRFITESEWFAANHEPSDMSDENDDDAAGTDPLEEIRENQRIIMMALEALGAPIAELQDKALDEGDS